MTFSATSIQNGHIPYTPNMQGSGPFAHRNDLKISNAPPLNQTSLSFLDINDGTVGLAYRSGGLVDRVAASFDLSESSTMKLGGPAWQDQQPHFTPSNATKGRCYLAHSDAMGYAVKAGKGEDIDAGMFAGVADGRSGAAFRTAGFVLKAAEAKGQDCRALTKALEEAMIRLDDPGLSLRNGTTDTQVNTRRFVASIARVEREAVNLTNALGGNDVVLDHVASTAVHQLLLENLFEAHPAMFTHGEWTVVDGNGNPLKPTGFINPPTAEVIQAQFNAQHPDGNQADQLCRQIEQLLKIGGAISEEVKDQPAPSTTPTPPGSPVTPGQGAGYPSIVNNAAGGTGGNASVNIPPGVFGASQTRSASDEAAVIHAKTLQIAVQALSDRLAEAFQLVRNVEDGTPNTRSSSGAGSVSDLGDDVSSPSEAVTTKHDGVIGLPEATIRRGDPSIPLGTVFGNEGNRESGLDSESVINYPLWTTGQPVPREGDPLFGKSIGGSVDSEFGSGFFPPATTPVPGKRILVDANVGSDPSGNPERISTDVQTDSVDDLPDHYPPPELSSHQRTVSTQAGRSHLESDDSGFPYDDPLPRVDSAVDPKNVKKFGFVLEELAGLGKGADKTLRKVEGDLKWQRPKPVESTEPQWLKDAAAKKKTVAAEDLPQRWKADFGYPLSPNASQSPSTLTGSKGITVNAAPVPVRQDSDMDSIDRSPRARSDLGRQGSGLFVPQASLADQLLATRANLKKVDPKVLRSFGDMKFGRILEESGSTKDSGRVITTTGVGQDLLSKRFAKVSPPPVIEESYLDEANRRIVTTSGVGQDLFGSRSVKTPVLPAIEESYLDESKGRIVATSGVGQDLFGSRLAQKAAQHFAKSTGMKNMEWSARPPKVSSKQNYDSYFKHFAKPEGKF